MDREAYRCLLRWISLHQEWQQISQCGADSPTRTDGQMLNGIRNRMKFLLSELEEKGLCLEWLLSEAEKSGYVLEAYMKELAPLADERYMKHAEEIKEGAELAWEAYRSSEDYTYIRENIGNLSIGSDAAILARIRRETAFVTDLECAIEKNYLPGMRRYLDTAEYLGRLRRMRGLLEMRIDYLKPFKK